MPVEDALALIVKAFGNIFVEHEQQEHTRVSHKAAFGRWLLSVGAARCTVCPLGIRRISVKCGEILGLGGVELSMWLFKDQKKYGWKY